MAADATLAPPRLEDLDQYRRELTGYCYRMVGSVFEADDAVQETMVRAWKNLDTFEGRSSLRSWLYRIATNVCLDMLRSRKRRAMPMETGPAQRPDVTLKPPLPEEVWVTPVPDSRVLPESGDPAEIAAGRESIRLAFVAALQLLPPKQRAALILCEVLKWRATEVAELLETTVASVNSALQRARATLAERAPDDTEIRDASPEQQALLARYVATFEAYDMAELVKILHEDAVISMPPLDLWLRGRDDLLAWFVGQGAGCRGSKLIALEANGGFAFASYKPSPEGDLKPWAIQVIDVKDGWVTGHHNFLDTTLFATFGLPDHLDA